MAWISITEADVLTVLAGPELEGYRAAALKAGQADPVAPTISRVVDLVRGYVGACKANVLGDGETIPEKLLSPALDIIAVEIPKRVGRDPRPVRQQARADAIRLLEQVARCDFDIEEPTTPTTETSGSQSPSFTTPSRFFDRNRQDGF